MKYLRILMVAIVLIAAFFFVKHLSLRQGSGLSSSVENDQQSLPENLVSAADFTSAWGGTAKGKDTQLALIKRASSRRDQFMKLMAANPAEAIKRAISISEYAALPEELRPYFERPLNGVGSIDLTWATSEIPNHGRECQHSNTVTINGQKMTAYSADRHMLPVMKNIPVSGIRLGNVAVIESSPVRVLAESDREAASELFNTAEVKNDPLTEKAPSGEHVALIAGKIYQFESEITLNYVDETLLESIEQAEKKRVAVIRHPFEWLAGDSGGDHGEGVDATPYQENQIDVLFIRVDFSDFQGAPVSKADLETTLSTVNGHLNNYSYGSAGITYTVSNSVYRMPSTGENYALDSSVGDNIDGSDRIQNDARLLAAADYTITDYDVIAVFFPHIGSINVPGSLINYGGLGSIGGSRHWINGVNSVGTILHEFGHNYGMYHANYYHPEQQLGGSYDLSDSLEYGDIFDEMGRGNSPEAHFSHLAKNYMQWMPDSKVVEATEDGTFTIYRFDDINAISNSVLAVKVPMSGNVNYWIGYRQLYTSSSYNLSSAAYVVAENLAEQRETSLIDMTPESEASEFADRRDAGLPVGGAAYYDSDAGVTFEALEKGGSDPNQWIKVKVTFDPRISLAKTEVAIDEQCGVAHLTVRRQFGSSGEVKVNYATASDTATAGSDFYSTSGTLTWAAGDMEDKTVIVPIRPDVISEGSEQFTFTLSGVVGGKLDTAASVATVSVLDAGQRVTSFLAPFFNVTVYAIAPLDDGRVMIGGNIYGVSGFPDISHIARLNADGSVDTSFISGTGFNDDVRSIVIQPDGKLLVGGNFTNYNGTSCNRVIRLNQNGSVDNTFLANVGTAADDTVRSIAVESGGSILLGGRFANFKGVAANGLVRLSSSGSPTVALTLPFNGGAIVYSLIAQSDGKIVVGGNFSLPNTGSGSFRDIVRLNSNGSHDSTLAVGSGSNGGVYSVARQSDGKYILVGYFNSYDGDSAIRCCRISSTGVLDTGFTTPAFNSSVLDVLSQSNGKAIVGGYFSNTNSPLERLTSNGSLDATFQQGSGPAGSVHRLAKGIDGLLWVGGNFFSYDGSSSRPVIPIAGGETPYDIWAKTRFSTAEFASGVSAPDQDPDGDGIVNLAEMAMGTNPTVANTEPAFAVSKNGGITIQDFEGQDYLQISLDKTTLAKGAWFVAQFSSNLSGWAPAAPTPAVNATYEVLEDSATRFTVRDKTPVSPSSPRFGRIVIKQPE